MSAENDRLKATGLALRLRQAREKLGLSQLELSRKARVGKMTASDIEAGRRNQVNVGIGTVERLASVLGVTGGWLAYGDESAGAHSVKDWMAPGFDPFKMVGDLSTMVNGSGGHIEQSYKYLDVMDAANWCAFTKHPRYASYIESVPIREAAEAAIRHTQDKGIDIIGLGVGTGRHEARLMTHLLDHEHFDLRLFLLDISQPLLSIAAQQAGEVLADHRSIPICTIHGNFHQLASYADIFYAHSPRAKLMCMFGFTFGNLDNEIRFVRNSLTMCQPDDLLLMEIGLAYARSDHPDEIRKKDPSFAGNLPGDFMRKQEEFNVGPIRRYAQGLREVEFVRALDTASCVIPGSYAQDIEAHVRLSGSGVKKFSLAYIKRYDDKQLAQRMAQEGWQMVEGWRYGDGHLMLCLFRRTSKAV